MGENLFVSADTRRFTVEQKLNAFLSRNIRTVVNMTMKCTDADITNMTLIDYMTLRISDNFKELPEKDERLLLDAADDLHQRRDQHGVLIHCYGGENRSCLLAGLVMAKDGMPGPDIVQRILKVRPTALYNQPFRAYLEAYHA
jgi:protein-tyrosine phosphatase